MNVKEVQQQNKDKREKPLRISILLLIFVLISSAGMPHTQEEPVNVMRITVEQGLSNNSIRSISQDRSGFMWFGTENGLNRYDGVDFRLYTEKEMKFTISDLITALAEDHLGNLWLGTTSLGLIRWDKKTKEFFYYRHHPENPHSLCGDQINVLLALCSPSATELWVGTGNGLSRIVIPDLPGTNVKIRNYRHKSSKAFSLVDNFVTSLCESNYQGIKSLWIGTKSGLSQLILKHTNKNISIDTVKNYEEERFVNYTAHSDGIDGLTHPSVTAICKSLSTDDKPPTLWIGTEDGLNRLHWDDKGEVHIKHYKHDPTNSNSLSSNVVRALIVDNVNNRQPILWIGTLRKGLDKFDIMSEKFENYNHSPYNPNTLSDFRIQCLYLDRSGILWVGTPSGGVNKLIYGEKKSQFQLYQKQWEDPNTLSDNSIRCIAEDPDSDGNILWIGTFFGGLNRLDRKTGRATHFKYDPNDPKSISDNSIYCIHIDCSGTLWTGTGKALDKLESDEGFKHYQYDPDNPNSLNIGESIRAIYEDQSSVLWIGARGGGLYKFDKAKEIFTPYRHNPSDANSISSNEIYTISGAIENGKEILWIGTANAGLNKFDISTGKFKSYTHDPSNPNTISDNFVLCIHSNSNSNSNSHSAYSTLPESAQTLWIGTYWGGLNQFDIKSERFTHITQKDGLPDHVVYGILCDHNHNLWLSSNMGLSKFNITTKTVRNYCALDGLQGNEFNGGAYFKNTKGELLFGSIHGLIIFHPDAIYENLHIPPIVLTVSKNLEEIATIDASVKESTIELSSRDKVISFEFAALDFLNPKKNQYAYKLKNLDQDWIYCGTHRTVNYTHLKPGTYEFCVKGSNNHNVWNEEGVSVKLKVIPFIWQTWWFKLLLMTAAVAFILFWYRMWIIVKQKKKLEFQMAKRTKELVKVSEKAQEMALKAKLAKEASEAKSRFVSNISHEIRTPLAGIIGLTSLALDSSLSQEQRQYLTMVKQSANHLQEIVSDLLDLSKIEAGQLDLNSAEFNFYALMEEVKDIVLPQVKNKSLTFDWLIHKNIPDQVIGDPQRLKQILLNLIGNAIKFTERGKIGLKALLEFETKEKKDKNNITIHFSVSDTGIGIPLECQPHIFESFTQADSSISRKYEGTGLGLAITRQLVEIMGGRLWFRSEPLQGSDFHFTLQFLVPQDRPEIDIKQAEDIETHEKSHLISCLSQLKDQVRLLLVEDNPINQKVARFIIKKTNIPIDTVGDGLAAIDALKQKKYNLVLMDIQMPTMDGLTATKKIRQEMGLKHIPIIAMTAHAMKEDREKCLTAGMNDYITKPFKENELYRILFKWLQC